MDDDFRCSTFTFGSVSFVRNKLDFLLSIRFGNFNRFHALDGTDETVPLGENGSLI